MIPTRALGQTGVDVCVLGFGVSGPHATPLVRRADTVALVGQAVELGVAVLDTAPFYGRGEAERRLGAALASIPRDRVFLITKVGTFKAHVGYNKDFSPDAMERQFLESLERLGAGHVDVLLLHGPSPHHLREDVFAFLDAQKTSGRARLVGACIRGAEADAVLDDGVFDVIMAPAYVDMEGHMTQRIARARAAGLGVFGIEALIPSQPRVRFPRSPADVWYGARGLLRRGPSPRKRPSPESCLTWALDASGADCVVTTTTRSAHLAASAAVAERPRLDGGPNAS